MTDNADNKTGHWLIVNTTGPMPNLIGQAIENGGDESDSLCDVHVEEWTGPAPVKRSLMERIKDFLFDPTRMKPVEGRPRTVQREVAGSLVTVDLQRGSITVTPPGPVLRFVFLTENLNRRPASRL